MNSQGPPPRNLAQETGVPLIREKPRQEALLPPRPRGREDRGLLLRQEGGQILVDDKDHPYLQLQSVAFSPASA